MLDASSIGSLRRYERADFGLMPADAVAARSTRSQARPTSQTGAIKSARKWPCVCGAPRCPLPAPWWKRISSLGISSFPYPTRCAFTLQSSTLAGGYGRQWLRCVTRGFDDTPLAIHRTFLSRDGGGKAPGDLQKMMLGPCRGGAVRLADPGDVLMVGEGIETCLAAMQATGNPAWAALSTSGLRTLNLPEDVRDVVVLADGDDPGEAAARDCAWRWKREGRRVRIARPPQGIDFNDMLMDRTPRIAEGVR
jgi:hypothetical protein